MSPSKAPATATVVPTTREPSSIVALVEAGGGVVSCGSLAIVSFGTSPMRLCARAPASAAVPAPLAAPDSDLTVE